MRWVVTPYRRYFQFGGRARRAEFWPFALWCGAVVFGAPLIERILFVGELPVLRLFASLFVLGSAIPALAVAVRRLHDINRAGWWAILPFTTVIMAILAIPFDGDLPDTVAFAIGISAFVCPAAFGVMMAWAGTDGRNRFGEDPRNPDADLETIFG